MSRSHQKKQKERNKETEQKRKKKNILLQQNRPVHRIDASIFLIPRRDVIELIRVFRLQELHGLLELVEVLAQDGYAETVDELG